MTNIAIQVEGLSKAYRLGSKAERAETLVAAIANVATAPWRNFRRLRRLNTFSTSRDSEDILWALRDVSFQIAEGEVVGFVGRNGAGKSTLLKILSRITEPTTGRIATHGRVSSLLEVGTGFHQELTGRENIYMNGTILGMKRVEIDRKFDEIVDFSGVERFLDTPVKRYSSGMKVRLAFSVAAHLEPEILIVDEVLAVGDAEFQRKCLAKMQAVAGGGRTVLFVSHNTAAVQSLCDRAIVLRDGQVINDGSAVDVVQDYLSGLSSKLYDPFSESNPQRGGNGLLRLANAYAANSRGDPTETILSGELIEFCFEFKVAHDLQDIALTFTVFDKNGVHITSVNTGLTGFKPAVNGCCDRLSCIIPRNPFAVGDYRVGVQIFSNGCLLDHIPNAIVFGVIGSVFFDGGRKPNSCAVYVDHEWRQSRVSTETALCAGRSS